MNQQSECAMVFCLAAKAQRAEGRLAKAIELYRKACDVYARCGSEMAPSVGLAYMDIAGCLSELGNEAESEIFFAKAQEIMRSNAAVMFNSFRAKLA